MSAEFAMSFSGEAWIDPFILPGMRSAKSDNSSKPKKHARVASPPARAKNSAPDTKLAAAQTLPPVDDDALMQECLVRMRAQDQVGLATLYDLSASRVYGVAIRIVRREDLAEEVVSDVFVQAWRDVARYDTSRGRVIAWLLIMARTRALDCLRRQDEAFSHPTPYDLVAEPENDRPGPEDILTATREGEALHEALTRLTPLQRQLVSLAFFRGLSHSEIADETNIPLGSVKTHIRRALAMLRDVLERDVAPVLLKVKP